MYACRCQGHRDSFRSVSVSINDGCGSTHLDKLQAAVLEYGADLGLAMMVTPTGAWPSTRRAPVDGDMIMAILANASEWPIVRKTVCW